LLTAVVLRRSAICIQRAWRWGLLKRRLALFSGAVAYVREVRAPHIYIEERMFTALNDIGSVDRYPPLLKERSLWFGYCEYKGLVLVSDPKASKQHRVSVWHTNAQKHKQGRAGLPVWFTEKLGEKERIPSVGSDTAFKKVNGIQGLLTEGATVRTDEQKDLSKSFPSVQYLAQRCANGGRPEDESSAAISASGGSFRFVELHFPSIAVARQRALMLYFCTVNTQYHTVVPLFSYAKLSDSRISTQIHRLWELYGLTWPADDNRVTIFQIKQRTTCSLDLVPFCGGLSRMRVVRANESLAESESQRYGKGARPGFLHPDTSRQRSALLTAMERDRYFEDLQDCLQGTRVEEMRRAIAAERALRPSPILPAALAPPRKRPTRRETKRSNVAADADIEKKMSTLAVTASTTATSTFEHSLSFSQSPRVVSADSKRGHFNTDGTLLTPRAPTTAPPASSVYVDPRRPKWRRQQPYLLRA
jgi:hypothetical protein